MIIKLKIKNQNILMIIHISCSTVLDNGRFATGSKDKSIIIYNKDFKKDFEIKEHIKGIRCLIQ